MNADGIAQQASELRRAGAELHARGNARGALRWFEAARELDPSNPTNVSLCASMHLQLGEVSDALALYEEYERMRPPKRADALTPQEYHE